MKSLKTFFHYLGQYKRQMCLFLATTVFTVTLETIRPYWLKGILDNAQINNFQAVFNYLILFGISTLGANLISALSYYLGDKVLIPCARKIRETIFFIEINLR